MEPEARQPTHTSGRQGMHRLLAVTSSRPCELALCSNARSSERQVASR